MGICKQVESSHGLSIKPLGTAQINFFSIFDPRDPEVIMVEKHGGVGHLQKDGTIWAWPKRRFSPVGGGEEPEDRTPEQAALRELEEEAGLKRVLAEIHPHAKLEIPSRSHRAGSSAGVRMVTIFGIFSKERPRLRPIDTEEIREAKYIGLRIGRLPPILPNHVLVKDGDPRVMSPVHGERLADFLDLPYARATLIHSFGVAGSLLDDTTQYLRDRVAWARAQARPK
jgi:8-oxo-dGTP pyrophosphatase MutT (NUDIX family)